MPTTTTGKATDLITFSRGSLATVTDADGKIKWAPHNLLLASEQFDSSNWAKTATTSVTANALAAPNGTTTADKLAANATTSSDHQAYQVDKSLIVGASYVHSVFLKKGEYSWGIVNAYDTVSGNKRCYFNLDTGVVGTVASDCTATISSIGSGWYLCTVVKSAQGTTGGVSVEFTNADNTASFSGAIGSGIYAWGASLTRADLGGMQANASAYPYYNPSTPKNLLGYSEAFSDAYWSKDNVSIDPNVIAAPNGSLTADKMTSTGSSSASAGLYRSVTTKAGLTLSVYAKAGTSNWLGLTTATALNSYANFNLATGTVGSSANCTASITPMGDGWYRCAIVNTTTVGTNYVIITGEDADPSANPFASGNWTSGNYIYLWGAQLSDSASLDAYAPNFGAAPSAAAYHGPRLDYRNGSALGLLVEEARTNLLQRSEEFGTTWATFYTTVTADQIASPSGATTADLILETAVTDRHHVRQNLAGATAAGAYTFSFFAKYNGRFVMALLSDATSGDAYAYFDLQNGTISQAAASTIANWTSPSATITSVGNGWYRCTLTATKGATGNVEAQVNLSDVGTGTSFKSYAGDITKGVYLWGAQLEAGSFATSYIPTAASTVTRNADVCSVGVSQFPYSASEGTIVVNVGSARGGGTFSAALYSFDDGNSGYDNSRIAYYQDVSGNIIAYEGANSVASVNSVVIFDGAAGATFTGKVGYTYAANDFDASYNGNTATSLSTSGATAPNLSRFGLGTDFNAALNGQTGGVMHIRQITYLPRKLSNAELQARTA